MRLPCRRTPWPLVPIALVLPATTAARGVLSMSISQPVGEIGLGLRYTSGGQ